MEKDKIKAILVDDEEACIISLLKLVQNNCPDIEIMGTAKNVAEGISIIESKKPELVFLDINLPDGDGFEILDRVNYRSFEVIFTTAYDRFALKAIEFSALYYLLKPIRDKDLIVAVERFRNLRLKYEQKNRYEVFKENYLNKPTKYILEAIDGFHVIEINNILKAEIEGKFTIIHMIDGKQHILQKPLADFEEEMSELDFFRIHNSFLINLRHVERFARTRQIMVHMVNGEVIEVAQRKSAEFVDVFKEFVGRQNK